LHKWSSVAFPRHSGTVIAKMTHEVSLMLLHSAPSK